MTTIVNLCGFGSYDDFAVPDTSARELLDIAKLREERKQRVKQEVPYLGK